MGQTDVERVYRAESSCASDYDDGPVEQGHSIVSVQYEKKSEAFMNKRILRRTGSRADMFWFGIAIVINFEQFGWNGTFCQGFTPLLCGWIIVAVMYVMLILDLAEMASIIPLAGAGYTYARGAFGPVAGWFVGMYEILEWTIDLAGVIDAAGETVCNALGVDRKYCPIFAVLAVLLVMWVCHVGGQLFWKTCMVSAIIACLLLAFFFICGLTNASYSNNFDANFPHVEQTSTEVASKVFRLLPLSVWWLIGIEAVPFCSEEAKNEKEVPRDVPQSLLRGVGTLCCITFVLMMISAGMDWSSVGGLCGVKQPLVEGIRIALGYDNYAASRFINWIVVIGVFASLPPIAYSGGRALFALSRAGYLPNWLSLSHPKYKTPYCAETTILCTSTVLMILLNVVKFGDLNAYEEFVNLSSFTGCIMYVIQSLTFIQLRRIVPHMKRPFRNPLGMVAPIVCILCCCAVFISILWVQSPFSIIFVCCWSILGTAYFIIFRRKKLIISADEDFCLQIHKFNYRLKQSLNKKPRSQSADSNNNTNRTSPKYRDSTRRTADLSSRRSGRNTPKTAAAGVQQDVMEPLSPKTGPALGEAHLLPLAAIQEAHLAHKEDTQRFFGTAQTGRERRSFLQVMKEEGMPLLVGSNNADSTLAVAQPPHTISDSEASQDD